MIRYSLSTSFVPRAGRPGDYMFYITVNRWEDERCVSSETLLQREVKSVPEAGPGLPALDWASDLADMAWNVILSERSAERAKSVRGANPQWPDTTGKPLQL
jgi:hypothetical protein